MHMTTPTDPMQSPQTPVQFDDCFAALIGHEGGYVNHPQDPGGETKFGISKRRYPDVDIAALTLDQARQIYFRDYWARLHTECLPEGLRFQVFDAAVHSGAGNAVRWLQAACDCAPDGHIGPVTQAALKAMPSSVLAARFHAERLQFLASLSTWPSFGRGWARRIASNLAAIPATEDQA